MEVMCFGVCFLFFYIKRIIHCDKVGFIPGLRMGQQKKSV